MKESLETFIFSCFVFCILGQVTVILLFLLLKFQVLVLGDYPPDQEPLINNEERS